MLMLAYSNQKVVWHGWMDGSVIKPFKDCLQQSNITFYKNIMFKGPYLINSNFFFTLQGMNYTRLKTSLSLYGTKFDLASLNQLTGAKVCFKIKQNILIY